MENSTHTYDTLDEMDQFPKKHKQPQLTQNEGDSWTAP